MKAIEILRSLPEHQMLNTTIEVIERVGFAEERTPMIAFSTKQALEERKPTPCFYLEIYLNRDNKGKICTHRKSFVNTRQDVNFTEKEKEQVAKQMLYECIMGGLAQSYQFLMTI